MKQRAVRNLGENLRQGRHLSCLGGWQCDMIKEKPGPAWVEGRRVRREAFKKEKSMPAVNVLIKPASSACNMHCQYCFYRDVADHRQQACQGMVSLETMERIVAAAMEYAEGTCAFGFQGGEPTLAGLDFYRGVLELEERYRKPGVRICNAIQTNGLCVDEEWARFLAQNHFLVGLSLDGPADIHNRNRRDTAGNGTFNQVMRAARMLEKAGAEYNILCVVTGQTARFVEQIYRFFRRQGFRWLQFIPCLEPLDQERGQERYHLSAEGYGTFLCRLFDLWFQDLQKGEYVSIRHLDNWIGMLLGQPPEACSMRGSCSVQFVVEGDGGVYPCDFYVLDDLRMGTVGQESFAQMEQSEAACRFREASRRVPQACRECGAYMLCRNGCRRDRLVTAEGLVDRNYYCQAYRMFFTQRGQALRQAAAMVCRMERQA